MARIANGTRESMRTLGYATTSDLARQLGVSDTHARKLVLSDATLDRLVSHGATWISVSQFMARFARAGGTEPEKELT